MLLYLFQPGSLDCVILGHSFIQGLLQHYEHSWTGHPSLFEHQVAKNLEISCNVKRVFLFGKNGATVESLELPWTLLRNVHPAIILLDLGTNDLVMGVTPDVLAGFLVNLARTCRDAFNAVVVILSVIPREGNLACWTPGEFKKLINQLDIEVKKIIVSERKIIFHKHKGFFQTECDGVKADLPVYSWSKDGIHPNRPEGRTKYKKSLRNAVFKALKLL